MGNLLRAQLRRTFRGRLFWVELAAAALLALTILLNGYFGTNLTNAYVFKLVARMFGYAPLMGVFVGLFTAHLWGCDYEFGTLRNPLICGHSRRAVYGSKLCCASLAGLAVTGVWLLLNLAVGLPLLGRPGLSDGMLVCYVFASLLMVLALAALCTLLASLVNSRSAAYLLCLGAVAAMVIVGMVLYDHFSEPYLIPTGLMTVPDKATGELVTYVPRNGKYVGGTARVVLELALCLLPGGQGVLLCEQGVEHMVLLPVCSLLVLVGTTWFGVRRFQRKELR